MALETDWIIEGLKRPGKTRVGLARHLGVNKTVISKLLSGKPDARRLRAEEIAPIAAYLGVAIPRLGGLQPVSLSGADGLQIAGVVEAGVFRDRSMSTNDNLKNSTIAHDPRFERCRQFACAVQGDGAAWAGVADGATIAVADYRDYLEFYGAPPKDRPVLVESRAMINGKSLVEWRVSSLEIVGDKFVFGPERIERPRADVEGDGSDLRIVGVVIGSARQF